jgi:acyl-coenzyme A thioesterase PaaI-like protein
VRWTFGVAPLPEAIDVAELMRSVAGLVLSIDASHPAVERLAAALREAEAALRPVAPADPRPRIGPDATPDRRVYIDHARDVGAFNPCFPTYRIQVDGDRASGAVRFPVVFEGPPGLVHGGFLALLFDAVVQHHNCDVGLAGKTTSLAVRYRRPTPLETDLAFEVERAVADGRIRSTARLLADGVVLCEAEVLAIAGDRGALPAVSPRRDA